MAPTFIKVTPYTELNTETGEIWEVSHPLIHLMRKRAFEDDEDSDYGYDTDDEDDSVSETKKYTTPPSPASSTSSDYKRRRFEEPEFYGYASMAVDTKIFDPKVEDLILRSPVAFHRTLEVYEPVEELSQRTVVTPAIHNLVHPTNTPAATRTIITPALHNLLNAAAPLEVAEPYIAASTTAASGAKPRLPPRWPRSAPSFRMAYPLDVKERVVWREQPAIFV